jgi:cell wall-associated NlpC family hydrolase
VTEPRAGAFGLVRTGGWAAWLIRVGTRSTVNHAFVYIGDGRIIEAEPDGATESDVSKYSSVIWSAVPMTDEQSSAIVAWAKAQKGVPYGWLDIAVLSLAAFGIHNRWIDRRIENTHYLICSQLVDKAYELGDVHLFDDGRLPGQVTPGDLLRLITNKGWVLH